MLFPAAVISQFPRPNLQHVKEQIKAFSSRVQLTDPYHCNFYARGEKKIKCYRKLPSWQIFGSFSTDTKTDIRVTLGNNG